MESENYPTISQPKRGGRNKVVLAAALVALLVAIFGREYFGSISGKTPDEGLEVGTLQSTDPGLRYRDNASYVWFPALTNQKIHHGDAILNASNSPAKLAFDSGGNVELSSQAKYQFGQFQKRKWVRALKGTAKFQLNGETFLSSTGSVEKRLQLQNRNAEYSVDVLANGDLSFKVTAGSISAVGANGSSIKISKGEAKIISASEMTAMEETPAFRELSTTNAEHTYTLNDRFEVVPRGLRERDELPNRLKVSVPVQWRESAAQKPAWVFVSADPHATPTAPFLESQSGSTVIGDAFVGKNFWRVSYDRQTWSDPVEFDVRAEDATQIQATLTPSAEKVEVVDGRPVKIVLELSATQPGQDYVVQAASTGDFAKADTITRLITGSKASIFAKHEGELYYRARSVNSKDMTVSSWSPVAKTIVSTINSPVRPLLVNAKRSGVVNKKYSFKVRSNAPKTVVKIENSKHEVIYRSDKENVTFVPKKAGRYEVSAISVGPTGLESAPATRSFVVSTPAIAKAPENAPENVPEPKEELPRQLVESELATPPVDDRPAPETLASVDPAPVEERKPASAATLVEKVVERTITNNRFQESLVAVQGFFWKLQSSQQYYLGTQAPVATGIGFRVLKWLGSHGFEGMAKLSVFDLNHAGSQSDVKDFEARYHYRFNFHFNNSYIRQFQFSPFVGVEGYKNTGAEFTSGYGLAKGGLLIEFPVSDHWGAGGEVLGGFNPNGNTKREISGHFTYFSESQWSLGCGYRLHYFEAKDPSSAPGGYLPYREGYSELYSVLNYHF